MSLIVQTVIGCLENTDLEKRRPQTIDLENTDLKNADLENTNLKTQGGTCSIHDGWGGGGSDGVSYCTPP